MSRASGKSAPSVRVEAKALRDALRSIEKVVERRNTIPILSNVKIIASTREMRLTGTDMDVQLERRVQADGDGPLSLTVPAAILAGIAGKLPADGTAALTPGDGKLTIVCGRSKFSLPTLPIDDFPEIAGWAVPMVTRFDMPPAQLLAMLDAVRFAASTDGTRYYLNGVFVHVADDVDGPVLRAVATDGHRLARTELPAPEGSEGTPDIILPSKLVDVLRQLLNGAEDSVEIEVGPGKVRFRIGDDVLTGKLIDGTFPDYTRVIPTKNDKRMLIDREALATAIDRVVVISGEKTRAVKLDLARDVVTLSVTSPDHGVATEDVPCDYGDGPLTIGFNGRYLLDVVRQVPADTVEILLADAAAPTLVRAGAAAPLLYVVMPLRV